MPTYKIVRNIFMYPFRAFYLIIPVISFFLSLMLIHIVHMCLYVDLFVCMSLCHSVISNLMEDVNK